MTDMKLTHSRVKRAHSRASSSPTHLDGNQPSTELKFMNLVVVASIVYETLGRKINIRKILRLSLRFSLPPQHSSIFEILKKRKILKKLPHKISNHAKMSLLKKHFSSRFSPILNGYPWTRFLLFHVAQPEMTTMFSCWILCEVWNFSALLYTLHASLQDIEIIKNILQRFIVPFA